MRKRTDWVVLGIILLIGFLIRVVGLNNMPYPLNGDEKALGYNAWSIVNYGTDEYGNKLPLYLPSIGDYKYPGYIYLSAPIVKILGLSEFSTRFLSVLLSTGLIYLVYKSVILLFKSKRAAVIGAILMAISPWSLTFGRTASESNVMTFFTFLGFYFLIKYFEDLKTKKYLTISMISFLVASFTYSASRIFIPLMMLLLVLFFGLKREKKKFKISGLIFIGFLILEVLLMINPESRVRANSISIFKNETSRKEWIVNNVYLLGLGTPTDPKITRVYFNKISALLLEYGQRYLSHFSPQYLFWSGDIVKQNAIDNFGNFYFIEILFMIFGVSLLIRGAWKLNLGEFFILSGVILSPVAASASIETPSAVRQLIGLPFFIIMMALGIDIFWEKNKFNKLWISLTYVYLFGFLMMSAFKIKPYSQPWGSDQGNKEMVEKVWELKDKYSYVFVPEDPYIDFLFYKKIKPLDFIKRTKIEAEEIGKWHRVRQLDNIIFNTPENCPKIGQTGALYVCKGIEVPGAAEVVEIIRFKDNIPKYVLVEFKAKDWKQQSKIPLATGLSYMKEGDGRYPLGIFPEKNRFYEGLVLDDLKD